MLHFYEFVRRYKYNIYYDKTIGGHLHVLYKRYTYVDIWCIHHVECSHFHVMHWTYLLNLNNTGKIFSILTIVGMFKNTNIITYKCILYESFSQFAIGLRIENET